MLGGSETGRSHWVRLWNDSNGYIGVKCEHFRH
jgi:hypothetical protein